MAYSSHTSSKLPFNKEFIMKTLSLLTLATILSMSAEASFAQSYKTFATPLNGGGLTVPHAGEAFVTPRGPVFTTGQFGNTQTTTLPDGAGQGFLVNNGNGTSTFTGPGGVVTTVPSPR
jgi:hypothetical protein